MGLFDNFGDSVEFYENPEPRCPCVVVVDRKKHDASAPEVTRALEIFYDVVTTDKLAALRTEIAIVTSTLGIFNVRGVKVVSDFVGASDFAIPTSIPSCCICSLSKGLHKALDMVEERKHVYQTNGVAYFRPVIMLITYAGEDNDSSRDRELIAKRIHQIEQDRGAAVFGFGVQGADMNNLANIMSPRRPPKLLSEADIGGIFTWLANSMSSISQSQPGERIRLPDPNDFISGEPRD